MKREFQFPDRREFLAGGLRSAALFAALASGFVGLRDHVEVFDARGQRQTIWDSPGKKCWLTALAVSKGEVFAADSGNRVLPRCLVTGLECGVSWAGGWPVPLV